MKIQNWTSFSLDHECWGLSKSLTLSYLPDKPSTSLILFFSITRPVASSMTTHSHPNLGHDGSHRAHGFWYITGFAKMGMARMHYSIKTRNGRLKNGPTPQISKTWSPKPVNITLYDERGDKVKDLELGRLSWIVQVGSKYNGICPYNRASEGDLRQKRRRQCDQEAGFEGARLEDGDEQLKAKEGGSL